MTKTSNPSAIILAAGKGTRMGGDLAKVLHRVADRPMLAWVVDACREAGCDRIVVVVGYQADDVRASLDGGSDLVFVEQTKQLGTGHAAMMAEPAFAEGEPCDIFVLAGDGPLIRADTLEKLLAIHRTRDAKAALATAVLDDPTGYGRVIRDGHDGDFVGIVEQKDATPEQLAICEVNPSYYCFDSDAMFAALREVKSDNAQGEYYLTDVPGLLKAKGLAVTVVDAVPAEDVLSINTPEHLAVVDGVMRERLASV